MTGKELLDLSQTGKQPEVEFTGANADELELDVDPGMRARLVNAVDYGDGVVILHLDLTEFEKLNEYYMKPNFYDRNGAPTLKWSETPSYPKDGIYKAYVARDVECGVRVVDDLSLVNEWKGSGYSYTEWLERKVRELRAG